MEKIRLLIIEDHTAVRTALQTRLHSSSRINVVATVTNVAEGTKMLCNQQADAALFGLPGNGKRNLAKAVEDIAHLTQCSVPVIVLVAYADSIDEELFLNAGASRYLLKDINSTQLINEIESVVEKNSVLPR